MLDEYLWGHIERISPEAPVPILSVSRRTSTLGGAGNVAENLRHWGVAVTVIGVVGSDETGRHVCDLLEKHGVNAKGVLTEPLRKTTRKSRLMSVEHGQQVFRLDEESTFTVNDETEKGLIDAIQKIDQGIQGCRRVGPTDFDDREGALGAQCRNDIHGRAIGNDDKRTLQRHFRYRTGRTQD